MHALRARVLLGSQHAVQVAAGAAAAHLRPQQGFTGLGFSNNLFLI